MGHGDKSKRSDFLKWLRYPQRGTELLLTETIYERWDKVRGRVFQCPMPNAQCPLL
ncbi:hypothetical protein [Nostoc sp.]|uniref:hypothetical protein n=1 Tax=Nostoc sp. TaxID=1180 RepID=UPI002FFBB08D